MDSTEIVKKISKDEDFNVYHFNYFRYITRKLISENPNAVVFMADINDLYISNQSYGKQSVNKAISSMIKKVRLVIEEYDKECNIAKLGDEIYIYVHEGTDEEIGEMSEKIKKISELTLSFSVGYSRFNDSFGKAIDTAEDMMSEYKRKYKEEVLKEIYGEDIYKVIAHIIDERFARSRFNLKEMDKEQVIQLRDVLLENSEKLFKGRNDESNKKDDILDGERADFVNEHIQHIEKFRKRSMKKFGYINDNYVLIKSVGIDIEPECISDIYFKKVILPEAREDIYKGKEMLMLRVSGVKRMNDKYGHDICDKRIREIIRETKKILKTNKVLRNGPIVIRGAKEIYTFLKPSEGIKKAVEQINELRDNEGRLLIGAGVKTVSGKKEEKQEVVVKNIFVKLASQLEKEKYSMKVKSNYHTGHFLIAIRNKVLNNSIIKAKIEEEPELQEVLFEYIFQHLTIMFNNNINNKCDNKNTPTSSEDKAGVDR